MVSVFTEGRKPPNTEQIMHALSLLNVACEPHILKTGPSSNVATLACYIENKLIWNTNIITH